MPPNGASRAARRSAASAEYKRDGCDRPGGRTLRRRRAPEGMVHWISAFRHGGAAMPIDTRINLAELDLAALEAALTARGRPRFHGRQIFQWIHRRGVADFAAMSDLGRELREELGGEFRIDTPALVEEGTVVGRHDQVPAAPARRQADRIGLHPGHPIGDAGPRIRARPSASPPRSAAPWGAPSA